MRYTQNWKDYLLLDASNGERLERWKNVTLIRPDPQIIWRTERGAEWERADARYLRSNQGGGRWESFHKIPDSWEISFDSLRFRVRPTGFKHTGLFPEQAVNWEWMMKKIREAGRPISVLNLFAYTGGATLACAAAGANVAHVDAAKGMVAWARENAALSGLSDAPIRWLVDDCLKFLQREQRRGHVYDAVIMDPPSYGRGPNGEVWKLEDSIFELLQAAAAVLSERPLFFLLNSYTTGLSASTMGYLLQATLPSGKVSADEIGLPVRSSGGILPCGSTAIAEF